MDKARAKTRAIARTQPTTTTTIWDYSQFIRQANSFNRRLVADRARRLPFVDSQTGVAQSNCVLWRSERERVRCQAPADHNHHGRLYSYPNRLKRPRRSQATGPAEDGADGNPFQATSRIRANSSELSSASSSCWSSLSALTTAKRTVGQEQSNLISARSAKAIVRDLQQQQPPRADSTGSHSFADSDSRDRSSTATSHSVESPRSQNPDEELCVQHRARCLIIGHDELDDPKRIPRPADSETTLSRLDICPDRKLFAVGAPLDTAETDCFNHLERAGRGVDLDWSNERETLKSKLSKRKHVGSSLIESGSERSLLVKTRDNWNQNTNGRKTTQENCNLDPNGIHQTNGTTNQSATVANGRRRKGAVSRGSETTPNPDRPYVCPICDQSYKTRPGLSYHFIHAHDTVLPRNLPVRVQAGERPVEDERKRLIDICRAEKATSRKRARKKLSTQGHGEETTDQESNRTEELDARQSCPLVAELANETHKPNHLNSESTSGDCRAQSRVETAGQIQADDETTQDVTEAAEPSVQKTAGGAGKLDTDDNKDDDDDDDRTVVESSLSRSNSTDSVASISQATATETQNELDANRLIDESNNDDETRADALKCHTAQQNADLRRDPARLNSRQNLFCDFCLGTADRNRRTRLPEGLISCSDCGSSGHPSCLRFSDNIRRSVQKYNWQCIECKTCSTCNKADHEDQLLFCDDCDRSYHTYCLSPRLEHPPEGNWTCKACLNEYYTA